MTREEHIYQLEQYLKGNLISMCPSSSLYWKEHYKEIIDALEYMPISQWISIEDRLPNIDEYNTSNGLFLVSDGNRSYAEYFDIYSSQKYFGKPTIDGFKIDKCVTKWMLLPKP